MSLEDPDHHASWRVQEDNEDGIERPTEDLICEECEKRQAVYHCSDCTLTLCHKCTDAIHIIVSFSKHLIRHLQAGDRGYLPPNRQNNSIHSPIVASQPALHIHPYKWGDHVTFRDPDIAPGLLFGTVIEDDQPRRGDNNMQYIRVLWIRGLVPLSNATYQASLTLNNAWPVRIQEYVSMYHAYRAVVLAERRARKLWRREKYAGRLRRVRDIVEFPTEALLSEILTEVDVHIDSVKDAHMAHDDFLSNVGHLPLRAEGDEAQPETDAPYPPLTRVRILLLPTEKLTPPEAVRLKYLHDIIGHMVDLYVGFAWKALVWNCMESRRREREALENAKASYIQAWFREQWRRQLQQRLAMGRPSGMDTMEVLRRAKCRQEATERIGVILQKTLKRLMRLGVRRWKAITDILHIPPEKRMEPWHPGIGIRLLKLPRAYAHKKTDGSLAVEDITKYKQFRQNHSGPTATSYWIVRERILIGHYPRGQAFPEKRGKKVAARSDSITCMLLQQVSTFVSLLEHDEWHAMEKSLEADDRPNTATPLNQSFEFTLQSVIAQRHAKLKQELEHAVRAAEKYLAMATKTLEQLQNRRDTEEFVLDLSVKKKILSENNYKQALANLQELRPLAFDHFPIAHNSTPNEVELRSILERLEARLRAGENLYIFSSDGRGRGGLIGSLLLGRLYGLSPMQALERQQRCHDCQRVVAGLQSTRLLSSPEAQVQINMVHQMLAKTDTIYAQVVTADDEDYRIVRSQRRGVGVQLFANTNGFMVENFPNAQAIATEKQHYHQAQRIAKKEVQALHLRWRRRLQAKETTYMSVADSESTSLSSIQLYKGVHGSDLQCNDEIVAALLDEMVAWLAYDIENTPQSMDHNTNHIGDENT